MVTASHYETLGVTVGALPDDVRRAYLELARQLHPDRWVDASEEERAEADRRMREVNEAWRVLGNAGRRLAYDAARSRRAPRPVTTAAPFPSGDLFVDEAPVDPVARAVRALPWAVLVLVLGIIFVFTAYATSDDAAHSCVRRDGSVAAAVDCAAEGARPVELRVPDVRLCPAGTEPFQPVDEDEALCLGR